MMRITLLAPLWGAAFLVLVGFLGRFDAVADTVSIGRPLFGIACLGGIIIARALWLRLAFGAIALLALCTVAVTFLPQKPGGDIRIYSKNLLYTNAKVQALAADIEAADVDVVVFQEVSHRNDSVLGLLKTSFPYQHLRPDHTTGRGIAVVSRHPFDGDPIRSKWPAIVAVPILMEDQRVWIVSAHMPWPWPFSNIRTEKAVAAVLSDLEGPIVIAGDFNFVPWSGRVGKITSLTGTYLAGPVQPTFHFKNIPLPIDLALAPGGGSLETRPLLGSDHAGIVADLGLSRP